MATLEVVACAHGTDADGYEEFVPTFRVLTGPRSGHEFVVPLPVIPESPGWLRVWFGTMAGLGVSREFLVGLEDGEEDRIAAAMIGHRVDTIDP